MAHQYRRITGREVDVAGAGLALRIEDVLDTVESGQLSRLDDVIARWADADTGR